MKTSNGATSIATCRLEPTAMLKARSILFFIAIRTAVLCSAALPMIATMNTPTKMPDIPRRSAVCSMDPTRNSLRSAMKPVAAIRVSRASQSGTCFMPTQRQAMKQRRHDQTDRAQSQQRRCKRFRGSIELQHWMFCAPRDNRQSEDEQNVADDRPGDRSFHDFVKPGPQRHNSDDQLRGISKR